VVKERRQKTVDRSLREEDRRENPEVSRLREKDRRQKSEYRMKKGTRQKNAPGK
jgi:hypothetical protein